MTLSSSDLQSDSDLDSIRNSCDVLYLQVFYFVPMIYAIVIVFVSLVLMAHKDNAGPEECQ